MIRNIFLDRDGIINEVVIRGEVVGSPRVISELKIRPEFQEFYRCLKNSPYDLFVVSNQPDIARGLMTADELDSITQSLRDNFELAAVEYCTHDDADNCSCRKPKPGLITMLLEKHRLLKTESILIGDSSKDILAGENAGIRTVLLQKSYNRNARCNPTYAVEELGDLLRLNII